MSDRSYSSRRPRRNSPAKKVGKTLAVILAMGVGYVLGMNYVGPAFLTRSTGAPSQAAPAAPATETQPDANLQPAGAQDQGPVAVITPRRHRTDPDTTVPRTGPRRRHKPVVDTGDQSAGDQTAPPEDTANIGGADHQTPGVDSGNQPIDANSRATGAGGAVPGETSSVGDQTPAPRPHKRHHPPAAVTPAPGAAGPGDTTPDTTGATSTSDHGTAHHENGHHWTAASLGGVAASPFRA